MTVTSVVKRNSRKLDRLPQRLQILAGFQKRRLQFGRGRAVFSHMQT